MEFKDFSTPKQIKDYLLKVLSRTGGKNSNEVYIYHYSNMNAIHNMINGGYIWLSSPNSMNDTFEKEVIKLSNNTYGYYFTSFSQTEENIAMYKMYAPQPDGAMLCINYEDAKYILSELERAASGKVIATIVRNSKETEETIEADVFWASVAYKGLRDDLIICGTVINNKIKTPLRASELAGFVKLYGWNYENELRLCAKTAHPLKDNEKLAIKIPDTIINRLKIVLCPGFDKKLYRSKIVDLKTLNVTVKDSEYDEFVDFGFTELDTVKELKNQIQKKDREIEELRALLTDKISTEDNYDDYDSIPEEGYHIEKDADGNIIEEGEYKGFELVNGWQYNQILQLGKGKGDDFGESNPDEQPITLEEIKNGVEFHYYEIGSYKNSYIDTHLAEEHIKERGLEFFFVADKKLRLENDEVIPKYSNFRTLEEFLEETNPDLLKYLKTGKHKYDQSDYSEFDI